MVANSEVNALIANLGTLKNEINAVLLKKNATRKELHTKLKAALAVIEPRTNNKQSNKLNNLEFVPNLFGNLSSTSNAAAITTPNKVNNTQSNKLNNLEFVPNLFGNLSSTSNAAAITTPNKVNNTQSNKLNNLEFVPNLFGNLSSTSNAAAPAAPAAKKRSKNNTRRGKPLIKMHTNPLFKKRLHMNTTSNSPKSNLPNPNNNVSLPGKPTVGGRRKSRKNSRKTRSNRNSSR
jgi:hypothetical protein